jgi:hypothetical protein
MEGLHWTLHEDEPRPVHPDDTDAQGWEWTLTSVRNGATRRFRCIVTGPGTMQTANPRSREAAATKGRSEAERVLGDPDPPSTVILGGDGLVGVLA